MAYITSPQVKAAKEALKKKFPEWKFSVTGGGTLAITIYIMEGPLDVKELLHKEARVGDECSGNASINTYYCEEYKSGEFYRSIIDTMKEAVAAAGRPYFDHSDSQSDYFHCAYYYNLNVGKWNKPYKQVEKKKKNG